MKNINGLNKRVLIIPDTHEPYTHQDAYKFLKAVKQKLKPEIVIHLGDETDGHAISFHDSIPDMDSAGAELIKAKKGLDELESIFPILDILESNHGSLIYRRMKAHGIPMDYIKPLKELYDKPKWNWHEDIILSTALGDIYLCHGKSGVYGKLAKELGISAIQGHYHSKFEITWHTTKVYEKFNMFCGSLVDREHLAFSYGKNHLPECMLGCGYISAHGYPNLIKMNLNKKGRWDGKLPKF